MISSKILWTTLPERVREVLMVSLHRNGEFYDILPGILDDIVQEWKGVSLQDKRDLLYGLAITSWEDAPWDMGVCSLIIQCEKNDIKVPKNILLSAKQNINSADINIKFKKEIENTLHNKDNDIKKKLYDMRDKNPGSLTLLEYSLMVSLSTGEIDWFRDFYASLKLTPLLRQIVDALIQFYLGEWDLAAKSYKQMLTSYSSPGLLYRLGECLYRSGDSDAISIFRSAYQKAPWDSGLILRLADMYEGLDRPGDYPQGKGVILVYSWNHAKYLKETLNYLHASDLGTAKILVLNNGSNDDTSSILTNMSSLFRDRLRCISLPTNIGAPAARNWLLQEPEAIDADWVVYLDDDALVPKDWLKHIGAVLNVYPNASIVGCQVNSAYEKLFVQSADLHFKSDILNGMSLQTPFLDTFFSNIIDFGYFKYIRPCLSVTGCCHWLRREDISKIGGFDIIFSPSQFDDLERDLRAYSNNQQIIYNGHICIKHKKLSGSSLNQRQTSSIKGNLVKLCNIINTEKVQSMRKNDFTAVFNHLLNKIIKLDILSKDQ